MIPRVIHQIWVGGPPPETVQRWMKTWTDLHPAWDYRLWTDENRPALRNEMAYHTAPTPAMKADILRYELLLDQGGLYVDADFECHKPIDSLLSGRQLLLLSEFGVVCNGLIGCRPGDDLVEALVDQVRIRVSDSTRRGLARPQFVTGPYLLDELFGKAGLAFSDPGCLIPGDYFFAPRTRVRNALTTASLKRYATHHALATWKPSGLGSLIRETKLRTRIRRFIDLSAA